MKKLIYNSLVLVCMILAVSCQKEKAVGPVKSTDTNLSPGTIPPQTGAQKDMAFSLTNYAGIKYEVVFNGSGNYTFDLQPDGRQTVNIQEGLYDITVYPVGNYSNHAITLTGLPPVFAPRAQFNDIHINSSSFALAIY